MRAILLLCAALLSGCNNMVRQPRYRSFDESALFADGKAMQAPPQGAVARDAFAARTSALRPAMTATLLGRGRERYDIYCAMCHGRDGSGRGPIVARGFPRPADFREAGQKAQNASHVYAVISDGYGVMYGHADRIVPQDRWAIAAYVQALQRTGR